MGLQRGFLLNKNNGDGRKKIFQIEPATSQSINSSESNFDSSDRSELLEYGNNILGMGLCGNEIESLSDGFDDYFDDELNSYDTDNGTDEEYE